MHRHDIGARVHKARIAPLLIVAALSVAAPLAAVAQAPAPADGNAPSEAVRRQALGPFRMILQNAHAPTRPKPAPVTAPPAQAAESRRASPAPAAPEPSAQASPAQAAAAPVARPEPAAVPAPAPQATPVAVAPPKAPDAVPAPAPKERKELVALKQDAPVLSPALLREHPSGTVKIGFEVKPDGSTGDVKVLTSTNRRLNHAAVVAVEQWRFQPIDETRPIEIELVFSNE